MLRSKTLLLTLSIVLMSSGLVEAGGGSGKKGGVSVRPNRARLDARTRRPPTARQRAARNEARRTATLRRQIDRITDIMTVAEFDDITVVGEGTETAVVGTINLVGGSMSWTVPARTRVLATRPPIDRYTAQKYIQDYQFASRELEHAAIAERSSSRRLGRHDWVARAALMNLREAGARRRYAAEVLKQSGITPAP